MEDSRSFGDREGNPFVDPKNASAANPSGNKPATMVTCPKSLGRRPEKGSCSAAAFAAASAASVAAAAALPALLRRSSRAMDCSTAGTAKAAKDVFPSASE